MPPDSPPPTLRTTTPEDRSPASALLIFAVQAYWAASDAGPNFRPLLPPVLAAGLTITSTLGAAVLLLTRIGVLSVPLPRWLVRVGPALLAAFFALLAAAHLRALAAEPSGDWQIDFQGPLLLLLAGLCIIVASEGPPE